jgi:hypothetical protein
MENGKNGKHGKPSLFISLDDPTVVCHGNPNEITKDKIGGEIKRAKEAQRKKQDDNDACILSYFTEDQAFSRTAEDMHAFLGSGAPRSDQTHAGLAKEDPDEEEER